jgi:hypothetical protein
LLAIGTNGIVNGATVQSRVAIEQGWSDWMSLLRTQDDGYWHIHNPQQQDRLVFYFTDLNGNTPEGNLALWNNGKVSIGTTDIDGDYGLYVYKGILTDKVKVAVHGSAEWSDHVLAPGYPLMSLTETREFIDRHGHLPGVPPAECVVEEGLDVAKTDAMLLAKIEELTLHLIALNRRVNFLETENIQLRTLNGR